jgi:hypothetical protein
MADEDDKCISAAKNLSLNRDLDLYSAPNQVWQGGC